MLFTGCAVFVCSLILSAFILLSQAGCSAADRAAAAPFVEGAVAALCPFEAAIPDVGGFLASSCPEQEAEVAKALAGNPSPGVETVPETTDAGAPRVAVYRRTKRGRVCIGHGMPKSSAADAGHDAAPYAVVSDAGAKDGGS